MPTPTTSGPASVAELTGDKYIDSLIHTPNWGSAAGTSATVTHSFPGVGSLWPTDPAIGFGAEAHLFGASARS